MEPLEVKVSQLLRHRFGRRAKVELESDDDGISGTIASAKFRGLEAIDRVNMVWDTLEGSLSPAEKERIAIIVALTPEEIRED